MFVMNKKSQNDLGKYNPPKDYAPSIISKLINGVEYLNSRFSKCVDKPIYETEEFGWAVEVEKEYLKIKEELDSVMQRREQLPSFHDIVEEVNTITNDNKWKTFFLYGYGIDCEANAKRCPETVKLLKKIPGVNTAFFSILSPNKHIPAHKDPYNGVIRYHVGLIVPELEEKCRIRIDKEILNWEEGKSIIFDDTYNHEVWNDTSGFRVVLFVDFVRPIKFPFNLLN